MGMRAQKNKKVNWALVDEISLSCCFASNQFYYWILSFVFCISNNNKACANYQQHNLCWIEIQICIQLFEQYYFVRFKRSFQQFQHSFLIPLAFEACFCSFQLKIVLFGLKHDGIEFLRGMPILMCSFIGFASTAASASAWLRTS